MYRNIPNNLLLTIILVFLGVLILKAINRSQEVIEKAKVMLASEMRDRNKLIEIFPDLPEISNAIVVDGLLDVELSAFEGKYLPLSAVEKFEMFIARKGVDIQGTVFLLSYDHIKGGGRVYKRVELDSCGVSCTVDLGKVTKIERSDYNSAFGGSVKSVKKEIEVGGEKFFLHYAYRSNRKNELVLIEASVLTLPKNFLERFIRQLEQTQPPYYLRHRAYQEFVVVGLVTVDSK